MNRRDYSTFETAKILGVKMGRFKEWYQAGFLRNRMVDGRHVFTLDQVEEAYIFMSLVDDGYTREKAKQLLGKWRATGRGDYIHVTIDVGDFAMAVRNGSLRYV